jgi:hypothetical protein
VRENSKHPLAIAMQIISENLEQYNNEHFPDVGANVSKFLRGKDLIQMPNRWIKKTVQD